MRNLLVFLAACSTLSSPEAQDEGLNARVAVPMDSDVVSVQLTATEVDCVTGEAIPGGDVHTSTADLLGMSLGDFSISADPFAADSDHDFTDIFLLVEAGCYDLVAVPLDEDGQPSEDCYDAVSDGPVEVLDGETTEVVLISTCEGQATGGLDTVIAFNEEPTVSDFTYDPSKFVGTCEPVVVCAEATDPNGDPMEFVWTVSSGTFTVVSSEQVGELATECIEITATEPGTLDIDVTVYDLLGDGTRIEDFLASIGNPVPSHDDLNAPLHVAAGDGSGDSDGDGVCDPVDICDGGDDNLDADGDGVPDDCDICELGDDNVDDDGNGIPDACDEPCVVPPTEFQWVEWNSPNGNSITGTVAGISATYTSSRQILTTSSVFDHGDFNPSGYNVPNANPTIRNDYETSNTITFAQPVVDPVFAFASVGNDSDVPPIVVPISFDRPIEVLWSDDVSNITTTGFEGTEGYAIVRVPGVHTSVSFDYEEDEEYVNFVFGAAGTTEDTDGDGVPDVCDPCVDDPTC